MSENHTEETKRAAMELAWLTADKIQEAERRGFMRAVEMLRDHTGHEIGADCMAGDCDKCMRIGAADWLEANFK